jgi:hypothetical protein
MTRNDIIKWILVTLSHLESHLKVRLADVLKEEKIKLEELKEVIEGDPLKDGKISKEANILSGQIGRETIILQNIQLIKQQMDRENPGRERLKEAVNFMGSLNSSLRGVKNVPDWIIASLIRGESLLRDQARVP